MEKANAAGSRHNNKASSLTALPSYIITRSIMRAARKGHISKSQSTRAINGLSLRRHQTHKQKSQQLVETLLDEVAHYRKKGDFARARIVLDCARRKNQIANQY